MNKKIKMNSTTQQEDKQNKKQKLVTHLLQSIYKLVDENESHPHYEDEHERSYFVNYLKITKTLVATNVLNSPNFQQKAVFFRNLDVKHIVFDIYGVDYYDVVVNPFILKSIYEFKNISCIHNYLFCRQYLL